MKYSRHYQSEVVKNASNEADKTAFDKLQFVIDEYAKTRPEGLKVPKR
ncbi:MAG: hypothetical protein MK132_21640 [Lentisphaerales bacterium]|nr:hypothetical protein [Lentisphaerales bacterium]